jgi:trans-aconitate methyltransferase
MQLGASFDFILLSAVWMHLPELHRSQAFSRLIALLKPGGTLAMSLRKGPPNENRPGMHAVSEAEVEHLAGAHGATILRRINAADLERSEVSWVQLAIQSKDAKAATGLNHTNGKSTSTRAGD